MENFKDGKLYLIPKKTVFLVWEFEIITVDNSLVQLQILRAIASTRERGEIYKKNLENLRNWQWKLNKDKMWFQVDETQVDHCFGIEDLNKYVRRNRI